MIESSPRLCNSSRIPFIFDSFQFLTSSHSAPAPGHVECKQMESDITAGGDAVHRHVCALTPLTNEPGTPSMKHDPGAACDGGTEAGL